MSELHVLFKVASSEFVVPAGDVLHMESYTGATPVPGAPPFVAGLVQVRAKVVPVVDLRTRFGLPPIDRGLDARIVVVRREERSVALLVDSAREVIRLDPATFRPPPEIVDQQAQGFVKAVANAGQRLVMVLDFEKVIGKETFDGNR